MATTQEVPKHGSRSRYRHGCRCLGCCRNGVPDDRKPTELRWPMKFLLARWPGELICDLCGGPEKFKQAKLEGLSDVDSDEMAIFLGEHPMNIWPGWAEAGLDVSYP